MHAEPHYSASDLARWGLLEAARREAARDALMAGIAPPSPAVLAAARQQWLLENPPQPHLAEADLDALVARGWRWQQWCVQHGAAGLASHFLKRKTELDQVSFWRLHTQDADLAAELVQRLREGECGFEQLARDGTQAWCTTFSALRPLEQLPQDLAAVLRVSEPGVVWGPRPAPEGGWQVLRLEQRQPAVLDGPMRMRLLQELGELAVGARLASTP
jgi:hypothetical protein